MTTISDIVRELGAAIRGDWGTIDGRSVRLSMDRIAAHIEAEGNAEMTDAEARQLRDNANLCLSGGGHWQMYCEDEDCEGGEK